MLHTDIKDGIKDAMLAKDTVRVGVLRSLVAAFTNDLVAKRRKPDEILTDEETLNVIAKQASQRKDSIEQFEKGGRKDLADNERAELAILQTFLPAQMSEAEIVDFVKKKQAETGMDKSKAGQLMGLIMKDLKGKADSALVKKTVDGLF